MMYFPVNGDAFKPFGIENGDALIMDEARPVPGDYTLLTYQGKYQLVRLLGYDFMKQPIICCKYKEYPEALSLFFPVELKGRMIKHIKADDAVSVNDLQEAHP